MCGELVIIEPGNGESNYNHRLPVCDLWVAALESLGAHSPHEVRIPSPDA